MNEYNLTDDQIIELEQIHRHLKDRRKADRVKAVIALAKGWSVADVAEILLIDEKTSRSYFQTYVEKGVEALLVMKYQGSQPKLNEEQMSELEQHLDRFLYLDAKSVLQHVRKTYGIVYSLSGITDLLHRLGFSYKKPSHTPGKQDPLKQVEFLEMYEELRASKSSEDPIYFADATHPQHNSVPAYGWIKKGKEKELKANSGRQRLNINGAINIETLEVSVDFYESINYLSTLDLFLNLLNKHPKAETIYVIVDNAKYNHSKILRTVVDSTKIKLLYLPPYSPNLNLIERYWKFFKKKILYNKYYETFDEFKEACRSFFRKRKKYIPELRTLLTENFHVAVV